MLYLCNMENKHKETDDNFKIDQDAMWQLVNARWHELMKKHPIAGPEESLQIAKNIFVWGYKFAWEDMANLSSGLMAVDELISNNFK